MILLIDNYDSFAHNLARYLRRLGPCVEVRRNDAIGVAEVDRMRPDALVLSPGPGAPEQAGCCVALVQRFAGQIPILGVCLGHQVIAHALGGRVGPSLEPMHGQASRVFHDESHLYAGLPNPFLAARYHSLAVQRESLPPELIVRATTADQTVMALEHQRYPTVGWQFHPESVLTECGYELLGRFLEFAGVSAKKLHASVSPSLSDEVLQAESRAAVGVEDAAR